MKLQAPQVPSSHTHPSLQAAALNSLSGEQGGAGTDRTGITTPAYPGPLIHTPYGCRTPHRQMAPLQPPVESASPQPGTQALGKLVTALPRGCQFQLALPGSMHSGAQHSSGRVMMG